MLALVASPDSPEHVVLREVAAPTPASHEALIDVRAISINRGEVNRLASAAEGDLLGWDLAGVVARAAVDGSGPPAGARVVGFLPSGAWAQQAAAPASRLAELPDDVSFAAASTLPVAGLTALRTLRHGGLLLGKGVLITGAAGGVGRFAVQLAARAGAQVTAVAGSAERGQGLRELGAQNVVTDLAGAGQFDLILESVGGASLAQALGLVAPGGTIVSFGNSSREPTTFNVGTFYGRRARMVGFTLLAPAEAEGMASDLAYLGSLLGHRELSPQIGFEASWRQAPDALTRLRDRQVTGKAVLQVD